MAILFSNLVLFIRTLSLLRGIYHSVAMVVRKTMTLGSMRSLLREKKKGKSTYALGYCNATLALLGTSKHEHRGFSLTISRLGLAQSLRTVLENTSKAALALTGARKAVDALARLLTRARSVGTNSTPAAARRSPRTSQTGLRVAGETARATTPRVRLVVGEWSANLLSAFGYGAHASAATTRTLTSDDPGLPKIVDGRAAGSRRKVLAVLMLRSRLRSELVQRRGTTRLTNRVLTSTSLTGPITAVGHGGERERGRFRASRFGSIIRREREGLVDTY